MATGTYCPDAFLQLSDSNGNPLNGGKLYTYLAGTSTLQATYSDVALTIANANPIILDSSGRPSSGAIFLTGGASYKFVLQDSTGATIATRDNISAVPASSQNTDITGTAGEALTAGQAVYLSDGSASKTSGNWYKSDSANTYSSLTAEVGIVPASIASGASGTIRIGGQATGLSSLTVGTTYYVGSAGAVTSTPPTFRRVLGVADTTSSLVLAPWQIQTPPINNALAQGRLTLTTGTPVTTSDVTGASTVYYTPYLGNLIALYDATATWTPRTFAELSIALSGLVNAQAYDVFAYDNSGAVALETAEWANATVTMTIAAPGVVTWTAHGMSTGNSITFTTTGTLPTGVTANTQYWITVVDANSFKLSTSPANVAAGTWITTSVSQSGTHTGHQPQARQTAITLQHGVYVKSGTTTRRYLGTFLTTATTTTEDSASKRYVWNYANRVPRPLARLETTASWAYTVATLRQVNASASNQVECVVGVAETLLELAATHQAANTNVAVNVLTAIGEDSTVTQVTTGALPGFASTQVANGILQMTFLMRRLPSVGRHFYAWLESSVATGTTTWYGTTNTNPATGLVGTIQG